MKIIVTFECANANFDEYPHEEAAAVLRNLAHRIEDGGELGEALNRKARAMQRVFDTNGNTIGVAKVEFD